ncbi:MAG: cobalt-precorrin-5B (C(1))-methyltransferase CbiD [Bacillota bacterium]
MKANLREGFTTGACAAASAKAAVFMLYNQKIINNVEITFPGGQTIGFKVNSPLVSSRECSCYIIKDAGDDPDITNGVQVWARAYWDDNIEEISVIGGEGIGLVTKPGLPVDVGQPAINPIPRQMIYSELDKILPRQKDGLVIEISIPNGAELAKKTLNPHLGIIGGLSILGTTGIVKPMSEEAYKDSLVPQLKVAYSSGNKNIVLTPGNIGYKCAVKYGIPEDAICHTSNFIGFMLEKAVDIGFKRIILWGHPGKLLKIACGNFQTHNRISDGRMETLAAYLATLQAPVHLINEVLDSVTTENAIKLVEENNYQQVWKIIAGKISARAERYIFNQAKVGTVLLKDRESILTIDKNAEILGEELLWPLLP